MKAVKLCPTVNHWNVEDVNNADRCITGFMLLSECCLVIVKF